MAFTTGKNFSVSSGFTAGLNFNISQNNVYGSVSATLSGIYASFSAHLLSNNQGVINAVFAGLTGAIIAKNITNSAAISATLGNISGEFTAVYDANVHRYNIAAIQSRQDETNRSALKSAFTVQQAQQIPAAANSEQQAATASSVDLNIIVNATQPKSLNINSRSDDGKQFSTQLTGVIDTLQQLKIKRCGTVDNAKPLFKSLIAGFDLLEFITSVSRHPVDDASATVRDNQFSITVIHYDPQQFKPFTTGTDFEVFSGFKLGTGFNSSETPVTTIYKERTERASWRHGITSARQSANKNIKRQCATVQDARKPPPGTSPRIDPPAPPPVVDPGHVTFTIPTQTVYKMQHSLSVTLLDLTPIALSGVSLSVDADAFSWQFKGNLADKAQLPLVKSVNGEPVQLIITINSYSFKVLVERIEHSRQFAQRTISLSGRGLTALLGQPYEQPASATQGSILTVQQIANLLLPLGWTIDWQTVVWNIPAGAYSYANLTPIQALTNLANDIGAMLVPSRNAKTMKMLPRYPVLPWDFGSVAADVVIPEAVLLNLVERPVIPSQANGVYVHGGEVGGAIGWCRRNSTAGDRLAATVSNALMTDVVGLRAMGERILAAQHEQPTIQSVTLPLDGVTVPLLEIGQLVQITVDSVPVRGIVNAVSIEASLASVKQTIQIGEETPNTWAMFKELLPRDPLLFATLVETDGTTSLMSLLDNGVLRVRGTGAVNANYYIRAGRIDGEAPVMSQSEIVI